ncbi:MAG: Gldg family protein [Monoglobaceae bacterium]
MDAIFTREWRSYFLSPIGYIFSGVFIALCSFFFVNGALMYQSADISVVFSNINIVYLFLVSILTMGLFSSERSRRTDMLLLTAPVSVTKIVTAKYLAAMWVFLTTLILTLIYPIIFRIFGAPPMSEIIGAYVGFILLWGAFIAIGLFISTLTESQMIAAVLTFGILLVIFYMNALAAGIKNPTLQSIVRWFSLMDRYAEFESGVLNLVNVVYYISFIVVFLFLSVQVLCRRKVSDRKLKINNAIVTAAVIAGVILVNAIVSAVAEKMPMKFDMTNDGVYNYSEETKQVLAEAEGEINIYALYPDSTTGELVQTVRETLDNYRQMGKNITVTYKDPYEDPAFAAKYGNDVTIGSVIVEQGDRFKVIPLEKICLQNKYSGSVSIDAEKQLTSAIRYVSGLGREVKAYFVKGHNEYAGKASAFASALESEGYMIDEITISADGIPEDADLIISLMPSVDFTAEEIAALDEYLLGGGRAAFEFTAGGVNAERLNSYLSEWGLTVNNDFIVENDSSMAYRSRTGVPMPAPKIEKHTITEKLTDGDIRFIAPASCSIGLNKNNAQYAVVTSLLTTSKNSWGIKDLSSNSTEKKDGDTEGPMTVAALAEKQDSGKIFVLGSLQATEMPGLLENASYCNGDLVMNTLSYLTDKGDALNIRAKVISAEALSMSEKQVKVTSVLVQYILPLLILAAGLIVWLKRRYM